MGDITATMFQNPRAAAIAKEAETWFGRGSGQAGYIDVPLQKTGDWWAEAYEKTRPLLTDDERKTGDRCRDTLKPWLNDWSDNPEHRTYDDMIRGIENRFNELVTKLNVTALGARTANQDDVNDFRNRGFSAMMAVSAGWCAKRGEDFELNLKKTKVTTLCDTMHERFGDPPRLMQIGKDESPSDYWQARSPTDVPARDQITKDLSTVNDKTASADKIKDAYDRLSENLLQVTDPKYGAASGGYTEASGMLFVEAVRSPLGCLRPDQPETGMSMEVQKKNPKELVDELNTLNKKGADHLEDIRRRGEEVKLPPKR